MTKGIMVPDEMIINKIYLIREQKVMIDRDTETAIEIQEYASKYCQPSFGIGTHFTNDFEGVKP
ncbi:MAG: pncB2 [Sphingobacteriaceae bacterium]|nr:pncB2 [Sphingobacteriaceae bacterium]